MENGIQGANIIDAANMIGPPGNPNESQQIDSFVTSQSQSLHGQIDQANQLMAQ